MSNRLAALQAADAVLDGEHVDWATARNRADAATRRLLANLKSLDCIAAGSRMPAGSAKTIERRPAPGWTTVLAGLAGVQLAVGFAGYFSGADVASSVPSVFGVLAAAAFTSAAAWLFIGGRSDRRARTLGVFYVVVAAAFVGRFTGFAASSRFAFFVTGVFPDAFMAAGLWRFARQFPYTFQFSAVDRVCRVGERLAFVAGMVLFVINIALAHGMRAPSVLRRTDGSGLYWAIVLGLVLAAVGAIVLRCQASRGDEQRRIRLLGFGLAFTIAPVVLEMLTEVIVPAFKRLMDTPGMDRMAAPAVFVPLLLVPFITAYAVMVERVLEVRIVIGRALQYGFARATLALVTVLPFVSVLAYGYAHRNVTLSELLSASRAAVLLPLTGIGLALSLMRTRVVALIDRHFFRNSRDFGQALAPLSASLRTARTVPEIVERLDSELQRMLQLTFARTFLDEGRSDGFAPARGNSPGLPRTTAIAEMLAMDSTPLPVGPTETRTLFGLLPAEERAWVEQMSVASIVPVVGSYDTQIGFIALGAKRSGASLSGEERSILGAAASAAALTIEARRQALGPGATGLEDDQPASECPTCGSIDRPGAERCECGEVRRVAPVPFLLGGKFRIERRLGAGGMGIVYAGRDIALGRAVALKTLSQLTSAAADRLGHEARMMASVVHPNLATIFGLERWRSTPILIVELLERGTLAARMATGPLPIDQVLHLGVLLAGALEQLHNTGVLHRDIKPSNIAFSSGDVPKLLDFGLASFVTAGRGTRTAAADETVVAQTRTVQLAAGVVAGTPLYLSPEAIAGREPEAAWDLWALSLVLYEAIAGRHPFAAPSVPEVLAKIARTRVPDILRFRPECPDTIAIALLSLLSADSNERPRSARALQEKLQKLAA